MLQAARSDHPPYVRIIGGGVLLGGLLQFSASNLGSVRGEWGIPIAVLLVLAAIVVEVALFKRSPPGAALALGLGRPTGRSLIVAAGVTITLITFYPLFSARTGAELTFLPGAALLAIGMFGQGGIGEEVVFRGFLFRHFRAHHPFWSALGLSMIPFVTVHLLLFLTLPASIAAVSVALAAVSSIPLSYLFELGGRTIWAPAILHAAIQSVKLFETSPEWSLPLAIAWLVTSAVVPLLALTVQPPAQTAIH